ncbi:hypothetical protein [Leptobacterium sp. I13]|uniref:DUF7935 family protein n=1 Tax=Leptobacterium meishanense TaxID=3128904 RepID=UPI0030ED9C25
MENQLLGLIAYTVPTIVTGLIAYYFFNLHTKNEEKRRTYLLHRDALKNTLPIRLQAYERMSLFLERINLANLLVRVSPTSSDKNSYEAELIRSIETEFEHNLSQQIYMSDECWNIIKAAKNATIQIVRKTVMNEKVTSANKLRETLLSDLLDKQSPSNAALSYIKKEVSDLW